MKRPSVLFVIPPVIPIDELKNTNPNMQWATNCAIPLGVLSIASYIRKHMELKIDVLDFNIGIINNKDRLSGVGWDNFFNDYLSVALKDHRYDIVGISALFNSNAGYLQPIAAKIKEQHPETLIVAGGGFPTNLYLFVLSSFPAIDAVAIGEGEKPFLGLLRSDDRISYLDNASGWMTRNKISQGVRPEMDLVEDLDEIPTMSYDIIDFHEYQKLTRYHGDRNSDDISISIMTSRGCPYLCNFCASHSVHGRKIRYYSYERVMGDIRFLKDKYGAKIVLIEDDIFLIKKDRALKILNAIAREDLIIEFTNGLSLMDIDDEVAYALKAAGLKMATLAVESGSERVLKDIINKPYTSLAKVRKTVSLLRSRGIYIRAFFIIGFPGERKEEIFDSVRFMKETGFNWVGITIATPIAGSKLYETCKKSGLLISDRLEDFHYGKCNVRLDHSKPEEITEWRYLINLEVNFVNNYDLNNGHPDIALIGFQDVIRRAPNHAFAHYFASECYKRQGRQRLAKEHLDKYYSTVAADEYWSGHARRFGLPVVR